MNLLKKIKKELSLILSASILYMTACSCSFQSQGYDKENVKNYNSEDVFRGIFFLEGDFVDEVPTLRNYKINRELTMESPVIVSNFTEKASKDPIDLDSLKIEYQDFMVRKIDSLNPYILDELKNSVELGNPDIIEKKLKETAQIFRSALFLIEGVEEDFTLLEDAYENGGIDPKNYDFTKAEDVAEYNSDMQKFIEKNPEHASATATFGLAVILIVVFFAFAIVAILAAIAVFGEFVIFYFNYLFLYNWEYFHEEDGGGGVQQPLPAKELILNLSNTFKG